MPNVRTPQGRYWLLTLHCPTEWQPPTELPEHMQWLRGQQERGTETGALHYQLFVAYKSKVRLGKIKTDFTNSVHAELSRSQAAEEYVFKEETSVPGTRFELGRKSFNRNNKTDWSMALSRIKEGQIKEAIEEQPDLIRYVNSLIKTSTLFLQKPNDLNSVCGIWIHGPPNVGKSHYVRQHYPNYFEKPFDKWWCGYNGEKSVLLDDLSLEHEWMGFHLKRWADKWVFAAAIKNGGKVDIRPDRLIVTSNYTPDQIWHEPILCQAITRRFYFINIQQRLQ